MCVMVEDMYYNWNVHVHIHVCCYIYMYMYMYMYMLLCVFVCVSIRQEKRCRITLSFVKCRLIISCTCVGLMAAGVMVEVTQYPQPALLYLVPGVLAPLVAKALLQVRVVHAYIVICMCNSIHYSNVNYLVGLG